MDSMEDSGFDSDQKSSHLNDTNQTLVSISSETCLCVLHSGSAKFHGSDHVHRHIIRVNKHKQMLIFVTFYGAKSISWMI